VLGKDRCLRALKGQKVDRASVHPAIDYSYAAPLCGASVSDCFLDPKLHAGALEHVFQVHNDIDGLYVNLCLSPTVITKTERSGRDSYATDISGAVWRIPANDVGTVTSNAIVNLDDRRLKTVDPLRAGINETYAYISQEIKDRYLIIPGLTGPFSQLVFIVGFERVLISIIEQPEKLRKALEWRLAVALEWLNELITLGAECIWIGEGAASSSVISPGHYREFVYPYEKVLIEEMKRKGITSIVHICGDITKSMDFIADTGADALDIDHMVDLSDASARIGDKVVIKGNVDPRELMELRASEVRELCKAKIRTGQRGRGIVLSTGCLVTRDTPTENIEAMVQASVELQ
jgi:MtaA/CmuA family methyltransferase